MSGFKSTQTTSHYRSNHICLLRMPTADGKENQVLCKGFVCSQGAKFFTGAELGTVQAVAYTNGDGEEGSNWKVLQEGELIYCLVPPLKPHSHLECYILVDDSGWPILTGAHPYKYMPANKVFSDPMGFQHSGAYVAGK